MTHPYDISGRVALVTGANRGIGKAIAEAFLEAGVSKLYAAVRDTKTAAPLVEKYGEKVVPLSIDLSDARTIRAVAEQASDTEVVVNNAGVLKTASPLDPNALEAIKFEFDINVLGLIHLAQAFAPILKQNGGGALVQLNSVASMKCFTGFATYSASKAASYSITQGLREALEEQGTTVLSVHPGPIATDMADSAGLSEMAEPPSVVAEGIVNALKEGNFHLFPDTMAQQFWEAYQGFGKSIVEVTMGE